MLYHRAQVKFDLGHANSDASFDRLERGGGGFGGGQGTHQTPFSGRVAGEGAGSSAKMTNTELRELMNKIVVRCFSMVIQLP